MVTKDFQGIAVKYIIMFLYHEPPRPTFLEVFVVNNLVFRWPKPFFFMVLGAHGTYRLCQKKDRNDGHKGHPTSLKKISKGYSKNFPTYPWNIPQTFNHLFMKEFLSFEVLGMPGVCSRGMLGFS